MREYRSFAALGDSFTEGVGDLCADGVSCRGWADRFAEHLASHRPGLRYANLAIRGKLLGEVLEEQVPAAISLGPDLVSLAAGGNDMLRPRTDPDLLAGTFEAAVAKLTAAGCTVMAFTGFDPKAFPVIRLIRGKAAVFSMHVRVIAAKYDCLLADLWPMRILTDRRLWSPDRLHMAADGHRRVALLACEVAGIPAPEDWRAPLTDLPAKAGVGGAARSWLSSRWSDLEWVSEHAAPYLSRRLHGISAGDGMEPKRPELATFGSPAALVPAPVEPLASANGTFAAAAGTAPVEPAANAVPAADAEPAETAASAEPGAKPEPAPV